ncbi:MAG: phage holin family protein [Bacteroidales bacterium]|nr:phage holin family protein [Bacteroidales bacterium]
MNLLAKLAIQSISIFVAAMLLPGVHVSSYLTAIWIAIVIALLNVFIRPLLIIFTIPITIFTFGLFLLVINAIIIYLAASMIKGFNVDDLWWAFLLSVIVSLLNYLMEWPAMHKNKRNDQTF